MKRFAFLTFLAMATVTAGCVAKRSGGSAFRNRDWVEGVTHKREVVAAWGNPDVMDGNVWTWRETRTLGGKIKASFRLVGVTVQNMNVVTVEHRLEFDRSGRLLAARSEPSLVEGEKWSLNPL